SDVSRLTTFRSMFFSFLFFFFKQKTAYEIGLGIPAEPLFRSISSLFLRSASIAGLRRDAVQPDIEAERKKRDEIEAGKSYCSRRFGGATCDDKSAQIYARFEIGRASCRERV